jgi:hypothetical protein
LVRYQCIPHPLAVYKLVRFYQPGPRDRYLTTRATLTVFSQFPLSFMIDEILMFPSAVVSFVLLLATFAVGLRCFSDFDRGLIASKVNGQYYAPLSTFKMSKVFVAAPKKQKYADDLIGHEMGQQPYTGGTPMGPRISIE